MKLHFMPQRSPEWDAIRLGRLTASCAADAVSQPNAKSKASFDGVIETESRRTVRYQLAMERIIRQTLTRKIDTPAIRQGIEREPEARYQFEIARKAVVYECGFIEHATMNTGFSPDGYLGNVDETVEIKCFEWKNHLANVFGSDDDMDNDIWCQLMHGLYVTGAKAAHLVFWCPDVAPNLRLHIKTFKAKDITLERGDYDGKCDQFLSDLDTCEAAMRAR